MSAACSMGGPPICLWQYAFVPVVPCRTSIFAADKREYRCAALLWRMVGISAVRIPAGWK